MSLINSNDNTVTAEIERMYFDASIDSMVARVKACNDEGACTRFTIKYNVKPTREKVLHYIKAHYGNYTVAGFFDDLKNSAASIVKNIGTSSVAKEIKSVVNSDTFKDTLAIGGAIFAPLGMTVNSVKKTADLVNGINAGNPEARNQANNIAQAAQQGDAAAKQVATAIAVIAKFQKDLALSPNDTASLVEQSVATAKSGKDAPIKGDGGYMSMAQGAIASAMAPPANSVAGMFRVGIKGGSLKEYRLFDISGAARKGQYQPRRKGGMVHPKHDAFTGMKNSLRKGASVALKMLRK